MVVPLWTASYAVTVSKLTTAGDASPAPQNIHLLVCMFLLGTDFGASFCPFFDYLFTKLLGKQRRYCLERAFSGMSVKRTQSKKR